MKVRDLLEITRIELDDAVAPYLWSDEELIEYANDAQNEACRRARLLVDSSTAATCQIAVAANAALVALDPRVIFVRRARMSTATMPLQRASVRDLDAEVMGWETATASTTSHFLPDYQTGSLRLYPPPAVLDTLNLTVVRLPLVDITELGQTPEINARYHISLRFWIRHRAYSKQDSETQNDTKAATALALFEQEFGGKSRAIDEQWIEREQAGQFDGTF